MMWHLLAFPVTSAELQVSPDASFIMVNAPLRPRRRELISMAIPPLANHVERVARGFAVHINEI